MKVYAFGNLDMDIIVKSVEKLPEWGTEIFFNNIIYRPGGNLSNLALTLKKLGINPFIIGNIGDDYFGREILKTLNDFKISTSLIKIESKTKTCITIAVLRKDGERFFLTLPGQLVLIDKNFIEKYINYIDNNSIFILCSVFQLPSLKIKEIIKLFKVLKEKKCITLLDTGWDPYNWSNVTISEIKILLRFVDFFLPNKDEAKAITKLDNDIKNLNFFSKLGAKNVIIKQGSLGSIAILNNKIFKSPAYNTNCLDTTGAGDSFNAAIIYSLLKNFPHKDILDFANKVSAFVTSKLINRFPTINDLNNF